MFICTQFIDQLPVGLLAQLVERCTGIAEVMGSWVFGAKICTDIYPANSFPRVCELRGTDNVQGQISEQVVVLLILHVLQRARKSAYERLTVYSVGCLLLSSTTS